MREAEVGRHTLLTLPERIAARPLPTVRLIDLRLPPLEFVARLARLYAGRTDKTRGVLAFLVRALDRPAAADAQTALGMANAAIAARKGA